MKKVFALLIMMTLGVSFTAMAGLYPVYGLTNGLHENEFPILEPVQYDTTNKYTVYGPSETLTVNYNVTESINRMLEDKPGHLWEGIDDNGTTYHNLGKVTFSTNQDTYLALWYDIDGDPTNEPRVDLTLHVDDYGIYFIDENPDGEITNLHSLKNGGMEVEAGKEFGVYYKNIENGEAVLYTTTGNWVGSFDGTKPSNHLADDTEVWFSDTDIMTKESFFCLFHGPYTADHPVYLEWDHFEFGFATGEPPVAGQPLPGALATILISGLCASTLRKKSKKN